jgi:hypothetical protein
VLPAVCCQVADMHALTESCSNAHYCAAVLGWAVLQNTEGVKYYRKPFQFLSLGIMAYVGNDRALTQVRAHTG